MSDSNFIFSELIDNQLNNIATDKRLFAKDIKRICRHIDSSIFDKNKCSIWNGYISRGIYINFFFRNKKIALHRLLYSNYVSELNDNDYLKYSCDNKRKCCNIYHMCKIQYINPKLELIITNDEENEINECSLVF